MRPRAKFDIGNATLGVALAIILAVVYILQISPRFSYFGFTYVDPQLNDLLVGFILIFAVSGTLPKVLDKPSDAMIWLLYLFVGIPTILMAHLTGRLSVERAHTAAVLTAAVFLLMSLLMRVAVFRERHWVSRSPTVEALRQEIASRKSVSKSTVSILLIWSILTYMYFGATLGLKWDVVALLDVYDVREVYAVDVAGVPFIAYLVSWQANVINPFLMVHSFVYQRWAVFSFGLAGQALLYAQTGLKSVIYSIPIIVVALILMHGPRRKSARVLPLTALLVIFITVIIDGLTSTYFASSLIVRRAFATPGLLTSLYIDFFSENPHTHLSQSIMGRIVDYPYSVPIPVLIGNELNSYGASANANFLADAFANFGWFGVVVFTVALCWLFQCIDHFAANQPPILTVPLVFLPAITLSNSALLTSIATHGIGLLIVLLAINSGDNKNVRRPATETGRNAVRS